MCGVVGILHRAKGGSQCNVGKQLVAMLSGMRHRGPDSTGVMVVSRPNGENELLIRLGCHLDVPNWTQQVLDCIAALEGQVLCEDRSDQYMRVRVRYDDDPQRLAKEILKLGHANVHSIGRVSEVIKGLGDAQDLDRNFHVSSMRGTHGIGHVRLATESRVDVAHSHPFWAFGYMDVAVVHNGQLTNYFSLKREFERRGHTFQTDNDSEVIALFLAERLSQNIDLEQILKQSLDVFDGVFTYLVATPTQVGYAKDRFSAKPLVIAETNHFVAMASEEACLGRVLESQTSRIEPQESSVRVWTV